MEHSAGNQERNEQTRLASSSLDRVQRMTSSAVSTGHMLLARTRLLSLTQRGLELGLTGLLFVALSIFCYGSFYSSVIPTQIHEEDLNFHFDPCELTMGPCSFLNSTLKLDPRRHIFSAGQPYTLSLILELPNSFVNQDLGMFMTCLSVFDEKQIIITRSCKSSLPEFRSPLLRTIETLVLSPAMMLGLTSERQRLVIPLMEEFSVNLVSPADSIVIEILSRHIQIYSARLEILPRLFGLALAIYHHPWAAACVGTISLLSVNIFFIFAVKLNLASKFIRGQMSSNKQTDEN